MREDTGGGRSIKVLNANVFDDIKVGDFLARWAKPRSQKVSICMFECGNSKAILGG